MEQSRTEQQNKQRKAYLTLTFDHRPSIMPNHTPANPYHLLLPPSKSGVRLTSPITISIAAFSPSPYLPTYTLLRRNYKSATLN